MCLFWCWKVLCEWNYHVPMTNMRQGNYIFKNRVELIIQGSLSYPPHPTLCMLGSKQLKFEEFYPLLFISCHFHCKISVPQWTFLIHCLCDEASGSLGWPQVYQGKIRAEFKQQQTDFLLLKISTKVLVLYLGM